MITIRAPEPMWAVLSHMDPGDRESAGIALAQVAGAAETPIYLLQQVFVPQADDYTYRSSLGVQLEPAFVAACVAKARASGMAVVFFHTHPFSEWPRFSATDDAGEVVLSDFLQRRVPNVRHVAMVIGRSGVAAREMPSGEAAICVVVGRHVSKVTATLDGSTARDEIHGRIFDRQVRALGKAGQRRLESLSIAIVGLGGTGSHVAEQLAHLGVRRVVLVDPDTVDQSNLSRLVSASGADVGKAKVDVAARQYLTVLPDASVEAIQDDATTSTVVRTLSRLDAVVGCTDSHGSRHVLNQLAYQYFVPVIDCGVAIVASEGLITHVFGRVQQLGPGLPCLTCLRTLDPEQVRRDLLSEVERKADPYIQGHHEPQPAVVSINGVVSSLAVTMLLGAATGFGARARYQVFDALRGQVRVLEGRANPSCVTCGERGALGRGDSWPMPGRQDG